MTKHTPTPWKAIKNSCFWEIQPENRSDSDPYQIGDVCASCPENDVHGLQQANAEFIVRAVNSHDALVAALEKAKLEMDGDYVDEVWGRDLKYIDDALTLAKAKGE